MIVVLQYLAEIHESNTDYQFSPWQLMAKPLSFKVSCFRSHSTAWHSVFCVMFLPGTEDDLATIFNTSVAEDEKQTFEKASHAFLWDQEGCCICSAPLFNLHSLASSFITSVTVNRSPVYWSRQKNTTELEGGGGIFKVAMFDLEKMPTNPLWISVWN